MSFLSTTLGISTAILVIYLVKAFLDRRARKGYPLPPGPLGLPLIGNLLDVPREEAAWFAYENMGKKYGDIFSLNVFGQTIVVTNSLNVAKDLFEKRGAKYLDRTDIPMIRMMHFDKTNLALLQFGDDWRVARRIADQNLRPNIVTTYRPAQKKLAHRLLRNIMRDNKHFRHHLTHFTTAIAMWVAYGYEIQDHHDRFVTLAEETVLRATQAFFPGSYLVNVVPALEHFPEWLPGMGFKQIARDVAASAKEMMDAPFNLVKERMLDGTAHPSISRDGISESESDNEERLVKYVAASVYSAGSDTTDSTLNSMLVALCRAPEIQRRAQAEIDKVVGRDRLPDWSDREKLPYVEAIFYELMRWRLAAPVGTTRSSLEEDVYNGYYIPKGSMVIFNVWAVLHDPERYPEPNVFRPERFLDKNGNAVEDLTLWTHFGFGKRMCPGRHLALASVWITLVTTLAAFNITKSKDENGVEIDVTDEFSNALVSFPLPFKCDIKPRDAIAEALIEATALETTEEQEV